MKTKISRIGKKSLSLVIVMMMVVSMMLVGMVSASAATISGGTVFYLDPGGSNLWAKDSARFAMYLCNGSSDATWVDMVAVSGTSYYSATVPAGQSHANVIFCRMNPATSENNWDNNNKWNQTSDLTYDGTKNLYKITDWNAGEWSIYSGGGGTDTPTDTTYYIGGRFSVKDSSGTTHKTFDTGSNGFAWNASCTNENFKFTADPNKEGLYYLDTNSTIAELSATLSENITTAAQYFLIHTGSGDSDTWYGGLSGNLHSMQNKTESSPATLTKYTSGNSEAQLMKFSDTSNTSKDTVTLWLDTTSGVKLYYTTTSSEPATPGEHTITTGTSANGTLKFTGSGNTTEGTANAGDTVTVNVTPNSGYACTGITVSGGAAVTTINSNSYTFVMPDQDVTVSATYEESTDKSAAIAGTNALWIDAAPDVNSTSTLIKWDNYTGSSHGTTSDYRFYIPKNVDLKNAVVYNGFSENVTFGSSIPAGGSAVVSLSAGTTTGTAKGYITVYQGSTDAMFIEQEKGDLPTTTNSDVVDENTAATYKKNVKVKDGTIITMSNDTDTPVFSDALAVDSIKGRGNSSWEASCRCFGKYAFNMKLVDATNLLGMDSAESTEGSKSWCLLANNADESMLRNAVAYQLAAEIGIDYPPEFRFVDIYDNNVYMGSYLITEKVDVGNKKLVKGKSIDDINEEAAIEAGLEEIDETTHSGAYTYNGNSYPMQYATVCSAESFAPDYTQGKFLLEFEIASRYSAEASWFQSPKGQYVVVKSPEFATQEEVEYIAKKFAEMEAKVYADNATLDSMDDYINLESFAKMYLIQELSSNLDSAATSYFVTYDCSKGTDARFIASPIWDYDWAFGQYKNSTKKTVSGSYLDPTSRTSWYAKEKQMGDNQKAEYSLQSKLASNTNFEPVIKYVWDDSFYTAIRKFYGENSYIDQWYTQISASVAMNEKRWGIIANDPISTWGSNDTGDTHQAAVNYLENTWISERTAWMNGKIAEYPDTYTPEEPITLATPTITATTSDGATLPATIEEGTEFTITATTTDSGVKFVLYDNGTEVESNTTGTFTITATVGTHSYTVKTTSGDVTSTASDAVEVTVTEKVVEPTTFSVVLEADQTRFTTTGSTVNLTATIKDADLTKTYTYEFFYSTDDEISDGDTVMESSDNTSSAVLDEKGDYFYYVKVTDGTDTKYSEVIKVSVSAEVTIYFKAPSAASYTPSVSVNGETPIVMEKYQNIGKIFSGTLTIYWYSAKINLDPTQEYTLTFTTKRTKVNASITDTFTSDAYYLAVDNLMTGTEVSDLTGEDEYIRNYYYSATHMVYAGDFEHKTTLGFTNVSGVRYNVGAYLDANGASTLSIKSSTLIQKLAADATTTSEIQEDLLDVNLDGTVDVTDAALVQKALVNG